MSIVLCIPFHCHIFLISDTTIVYLIGKECFTRQRNRFRHSTLPVVCYRKSLEFRHQDTLAAQHDDPFSNSLLMNRLGLTFLLFFYIIMCLCRILSRKNRGIEDIITDENLATRDSDVPGALCLTRCIGSGVGWWEGWRMGHESWDGAMVDVMGVVSVTGN
jgi:hypothetical protein